MDIQSALEQLDRNNHLHWTEDGAPRVDVVSNILGFEVKRKDITNAAPLFNRNSIMDEVEESVIDEEPVIDETYMLRTQLKNLEEQIIENISTSEFLKKKIKNLQDETDQIRNKLLIVDPEPTNEESIRTYLNSQFESRMKKHEIRSSVLHGLSIKDLDFKSPIDSAMARKTNRGTARPKR